MKPLGKGVGISLIVAASIILLNLLEAVMFRVFLEPGQNRVGNFVVIFWYVLYAIGVIIIFVMTRRYAWITRAVAVIVLATIIGIYNGFVFVIFIGYSGELRFVADDLPYLLKYGSQTFLQVLGIGVLFFAGEVVFRRRKEHRKGMDAGNF